MSSTQVLPDSTGVSVIIALFDPTTNGPNTGLTPTDLELAYTRPGADVVTNPGVVLATPLPNDVWLANGVHEIDATDCPGDYRFDFPDAAFVDSVPEVQLTILNGSGVVIGRKTVNLASVATQEQVDSIGSGATGGTHVEATYDNTTRDTIDNAAAVDKGSGLVGIPVTGHTFVAGREVTIAGTTNYNGAFEIISQTTNEVVITDTFVSETFGGTETIVASIKGEIFVGTVTSGTFANTSKENGVSHSMDDDGDVIDIVYGFNVGSSRQATVAALFANVNGNTDQMVLSMYDFPNSQWEPDGNGILLGSGGNNSFHPLNPEILSRNTGTGTELGDVFVRLHTVTTTPSSLDVDKCLLTAVGTNVLIGYPNGFEISAAGESGTVFGFNGTAGRPCPFVDALTMNAANPLNLFAIHNGETINLGADSDGISLVGEAWTLVLGGTTVGTFIRGANMSGTSTGSGYILDTCTLGVTTMDPGTHRNCIYTDPTTGFTMGSPGTYFINDPRSGVAGNTAPVFTWDGSGTSKGNFRAISTGVQFEGMAAGDIATVEGLGQFIEGTCPGGSVTIRGFLTTSGITNITLTDEARFDVAQINAQVLDVMVTDTHVEPSAVPAATASIKDMIHWVFSLARNKGTQTSTTKTLRNDVDGADIATADVDDTAGIFTRDEWTSP